MVIVFSARQQRVSRRCWVFPASRSSAAGKPLANAVRQQLELIPLKETILLTLEAKKKDLHALGKGSARAELSPHLHVRAYFAS